MKKSKLLAIFIAGCVVTSPIAVQKVQAGEMIPNTITFTKETGNPFVDQNNRSMVPLRVVVETLGCDVEWNQQKQIATIEKDDNIIEVPIGKREIEVNGKTVVNDTVATVIDGRTYLPIRAVVEGLGGKVDWNQTNNQVIITYQGQTYIIQIPKQINQNEVNQLIANIEQNIKDANYYRENWYISNDDVINTWIATLNKNLDSRSQSYKDILEGNLILAEGVNLETAIEYRRKILIQTEYGLYAWKAVEAEKAGKFHEYSLEEFMTILAELAKYKEKLKNGQITESDINNLNAIVEQTKQLRHDCKEYGNFFIHLNESKLDPRNFQSTRQKRILEQEKVKER